MPSLYDDCLEKPLNEAYALSAAFYTEKQWLEVEKKCVFAQSWQLAGHASDLQNCGDHIVCEVAGKSILIVRGAHKELNAFFNVCRHRAGPIATCNGKAAKMLRCAYHGWAYTLEGQLSGAGEMQDACDFTVGNVHLQKVNVEEWQGFIFVCLSDDAPIFTDLVRGIAERIKPIDISKMSYVKTDVYNIACNWKVYIDNFLEGYHLPFVHPGLSKVLDYGIYDTELHTCYSLQHSPLRNSEDIYGNGHAYYYFIYPNIMLNILPGRLQTNRIIPQGHDRCTVEFKYYYTDEPLVAARMQSDQAFSDEIQSEDIHICEHVQSGLASGSYHKGRLSPKRESSVWHFQNLLRKVYLRNLGEK